MYASCASMYFCASANVIVLQVCFEGSSASTYVFAAERAFAIDATLFIEPRAVRIMFGVWASASFWNSSCVGFAWTLSARAPTLGAVRRADFSTDMGGRLLTSEGNFGRASRDPADCASKAT